MRMLHVLSPPPYLSSSSSTLLLLPDALIEEILVHATAVDKAAALGFASCCKHISSLFRDDVCCVTRCLLRAVDGSLAPALQRASAYGHAPVVEMLCERFGADVHADSDEALRWAAHYGHAPVVELLCERFGADVHAVDDTALWWAANNGHTSVVEMLCERFGANVHADGDLALCCAATNGHASVVELLCERFGADVHANNDQALCWAAVNGHASVVAYLADRRKSRPWRLAGQPPEAGTGVANAGFQPQVSLREFARPATPAV